jgi:type 1 glutamine amidotransferase/sugar phosphate isomerase/epimerase
MRNPWLWLLAVGAAVVANAGEAPVSPFPADAAERSRIDAVLPAHAAVRPDRPRRLLIFDRNVGYGGHLSAKHANYAFTRMGEKTGAFATVISQDPEVFQRTSLRQFDAVFFNNTVGNLFEDPALRQSLVEFVYAGGGLLGVHGTTVAFTKWPGAIEDWPEFGILLGARGANHRASDEQVFIRLDDPGHPLLRPFGGEGLDCRDEFFRVHEPYSRDRVRVLWSIDTAKTDMNQGPAYGQLIRADGDYALAWVRSYGRGRVFYCTVAHNPYIFWDPKMLEFYLGAIQFALGDLPAPTTPSGRLAPAIRAQEQLGWRLGLNASTAHAGALFEAIDRAKGLGLLYLGATHGQEVSREIRKPLDGELTGDELREVRLRLDSAGLRLLTLRLDTVPEDDAGRRRLFEFGRKIGVETFVVAVPPASLETVDALCREYRINLALGCYANAGKTSRGGPLEMLRLCRSRSERIGIHADLGLWMRHGVDPVKTIRKVGNRLLTLDLHDLNRTGEDAHDVPWGTGVGRNEQVLRELRRGGNRPAMFGLADAPGGYLAATELADCIRFFNNRSLELTQEQHGQPRN